MPAITAKGKEALKAVKQMTPEEFDAFIEEALSVRPRSTIEILSAQETKLLKRIDRALPAELSMRYARLSAKRKRGRLSSEEHEELLALTHEAETRDADRAAALLQLARLRKVPVRLLMKQLGIRTPAIHG